MRAVSTGIHSGALPASGSFVEVQPAGFIISAVKQTEDGRGWVVRGYNLTGEPLTVGLKPWKFFNKVEQVTLAEEKLATLKPDGSGRVSVPVRGHEIISILFFV